MNAWIKKKKRKIQENDNDQIQSMTQEIKKENTLSTKKATRK